MATHKAPWTHPTGLACLHFWEGAWWFMDDFGVAHGPFWSEEAAQKWITRNNLQEEATS